MDRKILMSLALALCLPQLALAKLSKPVIGDLPYYTLETGLQTVLSNADVFSEISPVWYASDEFGQIIPYLDPEGLSYADSKVIEELRGQGLKISATLQQGFALKQQKLSDLIRTSKTRARHIEAIVNLTLEKNYDGIDLDYEDVSRSERGAFARFVEELAIALHSHGKTLAVDVPEKMGGNRGWPTAMAMDWRRIGTAADQLRIMNYDEHSGESTAGPVASVREVEGSIRMALKVGVAQQKIFEGIALYGYDWVGHKGEGVQYRDVMTRAKNFGAQIHWDPLSPSSFFEYLDQGLHHRVYFENARSTLYKINAGLKYDIGGFFIWSLGNEDPATWDQFRNALK